MSPLALADFGQAALRLELMRNEVPQEAPWTAPHAQQWDNETMWSWTRRNVHTGEGLAESLSGSDVVIDASNPFPTAPDADPRKVVRS